MENMENMEHSKLTLNYIRDKLKNNFKFINKLEVFNICDGFGNFIELNFYLRDSYELVRIKQYTDGKSLDLIYKDFVNYIKEEYPDLIVMYS